MIASKFQHDFFKFSIHADIFKLLLWTLSTEKLLLFAPDPELHSPIRLFSPPPLPPPHNDTHSPVYYILI